LRFSGPDEVKSKLVNESYIPADQIATTAYLAQQLGKPILVEGPPGVGKTELGKALARACGADLIRLQCYEGLDEAKALYEWKYAKQLLYTQILKEKIGEFLEGCSDLRESVERISATDDLFFSFDFLQPRPLLQAGHPGGGGDGPAHR